MWCPTSVRWWERRRRWRWDCCTLRARRATGFVGTHQLEGTLPGAPGGGGGRRRHPLIIVLVVLIGAQVAGLLGMVVAVRVAAAVRITVEHVYRGVAPGRARWLTAHGSPHMVRGLRVDTECLAVARVLVCQQTLPAVPRSSEPSLACTFGLARPDGQPGLGISVAGRVPGSPGRCGAARALTSAGKQPLHERGWTGAGSSAGGHAMRWFPVRSGSPAGP